MKKILLSVILCFTVMYLMVPTTAYADIGPKPSVTIEFQGFEKEQYYATLLSDTTSSGPHEVLHSIPSNQRYHPGDEDYAIWQKFVSYKDKDGFYFLQFFGNCTDTSKFIWGYHPPTRFKILLYFPKQDCFIESKDIYEQYAFHSYYKVTVNDSKELSVEQINEIKATKDYDYTWELISLFARMIATIAIEVLIALFFGYRTKKDLIIIIIVNLITQGVLNILLNMIHYKQGNFMFTFDYFWMEALVFIIEAGLYSVLLHNPKAEETEQRRHASLYALTANTASFFVGLTVAHFVPGIF